MLLTVAMSTMAMSYEQARERALFLTDKMAYELNLNDEQYEAAYEVNLDYLMSINTYDDLYGTYWTRRNLDLSYILLDWQYSAFCSAAYFYRPLVWSNGVWRFSIYARYPHRTYFYFGRPGFYATYRGGHSWHMNGGHSWYHGRDFGPRPGDSRFGMRDRFDRGDFSGTRNHGGNGFDRRPGNRGGYNPDRRPGNNDGFNNGRPGNNGGFNNGRPGNNGGFNNGRPGNNGGFSNGRPKGDDQNGRPNGNNGRPNGNGNRFDRPNTFSRPSFDKAKASDFSTMRSSTRSTVDLVQNRERPKVETTPSRSNNTVTRGNFSNSRPASTFTPSRNSSNSSFGSGPSNRGGSFNSSPSSNRGGGFSGGNRSGGGHFGGRR